MAPKDDLRVVAFSLVGRWAELSDGTQVPVTNLFCGPDEVDAPDMATTMVCGRDGVGWFAVDLADFDQVSPH